MSQEKTPSKITPFLVAALVCDVAVEDPTTRKKNLIGIFDRVNVSRFPTSRPMSLYLKITDAEGYYPIEIEYAFVNTGEVLGKAVGEVDIKDRTASADLVIPFPPLPIRQAGRYEFRVKASGMFLGNTFLDAVERVLPQ
jgi:hypothetical protein